MKQMTRYAVLLVTALLLGVIAGANEEHGAEHVLYFTNSDMLRGNLRQIDVAGQVLVWEYPASRQPFEFDAGAVLRLEIGGEPLLPDVPGPSVVWLTNGDILYGAVKELDNTHLVLETWFAGTLRIARNTVAMLQVDRAASSIYEFSKDDDSWVRTGRRHVQEQEQFLVIPGSSSAGRAFDALPDKCRMLFDLQWKDSLNFFFSFFASDHLNYNTNSYSLQFSDNGVRPYYFTQWRQGTVFGQAERSDFLASTIDWRRARVELFADRRTGEITVSINGLLMQTWKDQPRGGELGESVVFYSGMQDLRIHDFRIEEWNGILPFHGQAVSDVEADQLLLSNKDKVTGRVIGLKDETVTFETPFATVDIPVQRVQMIQFATSSREYATRHSGDVKAYFTLQGVLTFVLRRVSEDVIEGYSDNYGDITMPLRAFRMLKFDVHEDI